VWHRAISDGDITLGYMILFSECFFYIFSSYRCIHRFYFDTGDSRFYFGDICDNNDIPVEEFARIENLIVGFFGHYHQSVQEHPPNEAARFSARGSLHRNFDASQGESQLRALGISAAEVQRALLIGIDNRHERRLLLALLQRTETLHSQFVSSTARRFHFRNSKTSK
jgi:hypothetical protein